MLLKSLKISGFKSFGKTVTLEFPHRIAAIVGPNGSGKSNVTDAIAWVLGEQSMKSLRGKKGEDLIFNGSSSLAKTGKALVALNFSDETGISRAVYRDGANEYFINDSTSRLKDVVDFLGGLSGGVLKNHIINQGESDKILNASAKERREIIEDALGLRVFQLKKSEALSKLEKTEVNINQIESLRREIKPHLNFLKKQVEKSGQSFTENEKALLQRKELEKEEEFLDKEIVKLEQEISLAGKKESLSSKDFINFLEKEIDKALEENSAEKIKLILNKIKDKFGSLKAGVELAQLKSSLQSVSFERDQINLKIDMLNLKMGETGAVSKEVAAEYEEIKKRDDFLVSEISDLKNSAGSLLLLIKDLNKNLETGFRNGVSKINREFQKFFELMFMGGSAEIKTCEEGIDLFVNLPRKRIHSLSMLSGGERTLTSIALLFAISQVNPPPFLILDETDAALDESNSRKYAKMLKDLSKQTQLVLVTHNRETMSVADILYGVTMGADGVSRLLSLKFQDAEEFVES